MLRAVERVLSQTDDLFLFNFATNEQANIDYDDFVRRVHAGESIGIETVASGVNGPYCLGE